jgi:hypothetical protein
VKRRRGGRVRRRPYRHTSQERYENRWAAVAIPFPRPFLSLLTVVRPCKVVVLLYRSGLYTLTATSRLPLSLTPSGLLCYDHQAPFKTMYLMAAVDVRKPRLNQTSAAAAVNASAAAGNASDDP